MIIHAPSYATKTKHCNTPLAPLALEVALACFALRHQLALAHSFALLVVRPSPHTQVPLACLHWASFGQFLAIAAHVMCEEKVVWSCSRRLTELQPTAYAFAVLLLPPSPVNRSRRGFTAAFGFQWCDRGLPHVQWNAVGAAGPAEPGVGGCVYDQPVHIRCRGVWVSLSLEHNCPMSLAACTGGSCACVTAHAEQKLDFTLVALPLRLFLFSSIALPACSTHARVQQYFTPLNLTRLLPTLSHLHPCTR